MAVRGIPQIEQAGVFIRASGPVGFAGGGGGGGYVMSPKSLSESAHSLYTFLAIALAAFIAFDFIRTLRNDRANTLWGIATSGTILCVIGATLSATAPCLFAARY